PRDARMPLFVRVSTQPPLPECWSVNISKSGIGLQATGGPRSAAVVEGSDLDLELDLPDSGSKVRGWGRRGGGGGGGWWGGRIWPGGWPCGPRGGGGGGGGGWCGGTTVWRGRA